MCSSDLTEDEMMLREALEEEAIKVKDRMTAHEEPLPFDHFRAGAVKVKVASRDDPLPFDYCRLGAIQRKVSSSK